MSASAAPPADRVLGNQPIVGARDAARAIARAGRVVVVATIEAAGQRVQSRDRSPRRAVRASFATSGIPEPTIDEMIEAAIESCRAMDWSTDLLTCLDGVNDQNDLTKCQGFLTQEQTEDLTRRMMDVVSRMSQVTPPPPTP